MLRVLSFLALVFSLVPPMAGQCLHWSSLRVLNQNVSYCSHWTVSGAGIGKLSCTGSPVTCTFYDDTAGTGATTVVVRAGAGQAAANLQEWKNAAGLTLANVQDTGYVNVQAIADLSGAYSWVWIGTGGYMGSTTKLVWSSITNASGTPDLALSRTSAGILEINSGTSGKWGKLNTGAVLVNSLATPGIVTVTPTCVPGLCASTWTYTVEALLADGTSTTVPGAAGSTALQNATLDASNFNSLTCAAVTGATSYRFRRTVSGGTPATLGVIGTAATCALVDNGLVGDASAAPTVNTTGSILWATDGVGSVGTKWASRPYSVSVSGEVNAPNIQMLGATGQLYWDTAGTTLRAPSNGVVTFYNAALTDFSCLQLGGTTNAYPCISRDGAGIKIMDATNTTPSTLSAGPGGSVAAWKKYSLVAIANGVNGCANANGCWQVNGVLGANKAAGLTQDVTLFQLPARGHIGNWRIKTATACTGATTIKTGLGTTGNNVLFRALTYDLMAAVSDTNLTNGPTAGAGSDTHAATNIVASVITTVENIDQVASGCAIDFYLSWAVLP